MTHCFQTKTSSIQVVLEFHLCLEMNAMLQKWQIWQKSTTIDNLGKFGDISPILSQPYIYYNLHHWEADDLVESTCH